MNVLQTARRRWFLGVLIALACGTARADDGSVAARAAEAATTLSAYARVEPIALLRLKAASSGVLTGLRVVPGERVAAGAALARLAGPEAAARLAQDRGRLDTAQAALKAARGALAAARQRRAERLATRQAVVRAAADVAQARARRDAARAGLAAARAARALHAPVAGTVLALEAADGERVAPGQTILTLQPADALWLKAAFYGRAARALRAGMRGRFTPANGGSGVPVRVRSVYGALRADGAREAGLVAAGPDPGWLSGEAGSVVLEGPTRTLAAVPTRALILDAGRWWVLVHGSQGDKRRAVTPGPSRGEWTLIRRGLTPGTRVVVTNAYLEFHREVARRYAPPD